MMSFRRLHFLIFLLLVAGCGPGEPPAPEETVTESVRSEVVRGPVTLTVEVAPASIRLSDEPVLTLTIKSSPGVEVTKPPFGEAVGEFLIRDFYEPLPASEDGQQLIRQIYTLEPTRAGTLTIAPIAVKFRVSTEQGETGEHVVESEALSVEVSTMVGDSTPSLNNLKPAEAPVELPSSGPPAWVWIATGLFLASLAVAVWLVRRRQLEARRKPPLTPQQQAQLELDQIIGRQLADSDVKEFYLELTGVVRRYIERSSGIRAPEQTTEEFLRDVLTQAVFAEDEQRRLRQFLQSADLVKFAGHQPASEDVDASVDHARRFIRLNPDQSQEAPVE